jgi:hypothetical protein
MNSSPEPGRHTPVDRRVRRQALLMAAIALVLLVLVGRELFRGLLGPLGAAAGLAGGLVVGVAASRVHRFDWDERTRRVVGHWATGATLTALGLAASAGTLAGRALGTVRRVRQVAQDHDS